MRIALRVANEPKLLIACIIGNIVVCGGIYAALEHHGPVAGMWWAVVTGSTVGYGDQYPTTTAGRFVGMFLIVTSIMFVSIATAQFAAKLIVNSDAWTDDEQEDLKRKINEIHEWVERQRVDA